MEESRLWPIALAWLQQKYSSTIFEIPLFNLHELHQTITEDLRSRLVGDALTRIPFYDPLHIEPDIVGVVRNKKNASESLAWITAEVKVNEVNMNDFREAMFFR